MVCFEEVSTLVKFRRIALSVQNLNEHSQIQYELERENQFLPKCQASFHKKYNS